MASGIKNRGFASIDVKRRREIASMGGKAAHAQKTAHEWTPEEARLAGRRGGLASRGGRGKAAAGVVETPGTKAAA